MPLVDGHQVYRAMQADDTLSRIPVIVSTWTPSWAPEGALMVPKPVKLDHLLATVAELSSVPLH